jgi:hypothetical protein
MADNEEGIIEVKKRVYPEGTPSEEAPLFVYLHCLLVAQLFVYLS